MKPDLDAMKELAKQQASQDRSGHEFGRVEREVNVAILLENLPQANAIITETAAY